MSTSPQSNAREILTALGIGHYNATMMIQDLFVAPATSDPKSPQIILIVRRLQEILRQMGAAISVSGQIDQATSFYLETLLGHGYLNLPWAQVVSGVLDARDGGVSLSAPEMVPSQSGRSGSASSMSGIFDTPSFLPSVPGGLVTYGVVGFFLYRHFTKRSR